MWRKKKTDLRKPTEKLAGLLTDLKKALRKDANAEQQAKVFGQGCEFLTELVKNLKRSNSEIFALEKETKGVHGGNSR